MKRAVSDRNLQYNIVTVDKHLMAILYKSKNIKNRFIVQLLLQLSLMLAWSRF